MLRRHNKKHTKELEIQRNGWHWMNIFQLEYSSFVRSSFRGDEHDADANERLDVSAFCRFTMIFPCSGFFIFFAVFEITLPQPVVYAITFRIVAILCRKFTSPLFAFRFDGSSGFAFLGIKRFFGSVSPVPLNVCFKSQGFVWIYYTKKTKEIASL